MIDKLISKIRLLYGKCTECHSPIPDWDLSTSLDGNRLICQRCRKQEPYHDRCPICNGGGQKRIGNEMYSFEEVQLMDSECFLYLINDIYHQMNYGPQYLLERRFLECEGCHRYILRDNPGCPSCDRKAPYYKEEIKSFQDIYGRAPMCVIDK